MTSKKMILIETGLATLFALVSHLIFSMECFDDISIYIKIVIFSVVIGCMTFELFYSFWKPELEASNDRKRTN